MIRFQYQSSIRGCSTSRSARFASSSSWTPDGISSLLTYSSTCIPFALAVDSAWSQSMYTLRMVHHFVFPRERSPPKLLASLAERFRTPVLRSLDSMRAIVVAFEVGPSRMGTTASTDTAYEDHLITVVQTVDRADLPISGRQNVRYSLRHSLRYS